MVKASQMRGYGPTLGEAVLQRLGGVSGVSEDFADHSDGRSLLVERRRTRTAEGTHVQPRLAEAPLPGLARAVDPPRTTLDEETLLASLGKGADIEQEFAVQLDHPRISRILRVTDVDEPAFEVDVAFYPDAREFQREQLRQMARSGSSIEAAARHVGVHRVTARRYFGGV